MHDGKRWRMPVADFALVRGATEPITSTGTIRRAQRRVHASIARSSRAVASPLSADDVRLWRYDVL
jgi:hypothetical protein